MQWFSVIFIYLKVLTRALCHATESVQKAELVTGSSFFLFLEWQHVLLGAFATITGDRWKWRASCKLADVERRRVWSKSIKWKNEMQAALCGFADLSLFYNVELSQVEVRRGWTTHKVLECQCAGAEHEKVTEYMHIIFCCLEIVVISCQRCGAGHVNRRT